MEHVVGGLMLRRKSRAGLTRKAALWVQRKRAKLFPTRPRTNYSRTRPGTKMPGEFS